MEHFSNKYSKYNGNCILSEFPTPKSKFFFFQLSFELHICRLQTSPTLTYIWLKEPFWNNIFQQSFGSNTETEKCFKIAIDRAISNAHDAWNKYSEIVLLDFFDFKEKLFFDLKSFHLLHEKDMKLDFNTSLCK